MTDFKTNDKEYIHNGADSPLLNIEKLKGFPIFTVAPTHNAMEGQIVLANESGTYKLYAFINGGWRGVILT